MASGVWLGCWGDASYLPPRLEIYTATLSTESDTSKRVFAEADCGDQTCGNGSFPPTPQSENGIGENYKHTVLTADRLPIGARSSRGRPSRKRMRRLEDVTSSGHSSSASSECGNKDVPTSTVVINIIDTSKLCQPPLRSGEIDQRWKRRRRTR